MADCGCHAADLAVPSFDQADFNPEVPDIFPVTDRRYTRRDIGLGIKQAGFCGERDFSIQRETAAEEM